MENENKNKKKLPLFDPFCKAAKAQPVVTPADTAEVTPPTEEAVDTEDVKEVPSDSASLGDIVTTENTMAAPTDTMEDEGTEASVQDTDASPVDIQERGVAEEAPATDENPVTEEASAEDTAAQEISATGYGSYGRDNASAASTVTESMAPTAPAPSSSAITALILGILSVTVGCGNITGAILGGIAVFFSFRAKPKTTPKTPMPGMAKAGAICGFIGIGVAILSLLTVVATWVLLIIMFILSEATGGAVYPNEEIYEIVSLLI